MSSLDLYILAFIIPLIAQIYVKFTYNKCSRDENSKRISGFEVARKILDANGLKDMYVVKVKGTLTDHYDPTRKTVRLSEDVFDDATVASIAIAAHECGHAIQDKEGYLFFRIRSFICPIVNLGTKLAYIVLVIGLISEWLECIYLGIGLVSLGLVFQLITLPVEIDASRRANKILKEMDLIDDTDNVKTMLISAALTYVAGVISSALEVLRLILIFRDKD